MQESKQATEQVIDEVWSSALSKIMKQQGQAATGPLRPSLGDDIDLFVPQAATVALMSANPAFAGVLYNSAYTSANRNAYIITRRLGMPADFFWKFDYWTKERAFETLQKILGRVFATLMTKHKAGTLELTAVEVETSRFELTFSNCAECSGLKASNPLCFFQAGLFAGILGALLGRDIDAVETACIGAGAPACKFKLGKRDDREIKMPLEERLRGTAVKLDVPARVRESLDRHNVRELGNLVDVTYYQLLLSSSFLTNLDVLAQSCFTTGQETGKALAPLLKERFQGDAQAVINGFYHELRHLQVHITDKGGPVEVRASEAPEAVGPLAGATTTPFLCGEMESLLSALLGRGLRFDRVQTGPDGLLLFFVP